LARGGVDGPRDHVGSAPVSAGFKFDAAPCIGMCIFNSHLANMLQVLGADHEISHKGRRLLPAIRLRKTSTDRRCNSYHSKRSSPILRYVVPKGMTSRLFPKMKLKPTTTEDISATYPKTLSCPQMSRSIPSLTPRRDMPSRGDYAGLSQR
jgi:hypothetical protein